jgi:hypothetical protein
MYLLLGSGLRGKTVLPGFLLPKQQILLSQPGKRGQQPVRADQLMLPAAMVSSGLRAFPCTLLYHKIKLGFSTLVVHF